MSDQCPVHLPRVDHPGQPSRPPGRTQVLLLVAEANLLRCKAFARRPPRTPRASIMSKRYASAQYTRVYEDPEDRKRKEFENDDSLFAGMPYAKQGMSASPAARSSHAARADAHHATWWTWSTLSAPSSTRRARSTSRTKSSSTCGCRRKDEAFFQRRGVAMNPPAGAVSGARATAMTSTRRRTRRAPAPAAACRRLHAL